VVNIYSIPSSGKMVSRYQRIKENEDR